MINKWLSLGIWGMTNFNFKRMHRVDNVGKLKDHQHLYKIFLNVLMELHNFSRNDNQHSRCDIAIKDNEIKLIVYSLGKGRPSS